MSSRFAAAARAVNIRVDEPVPDDEGRVGFAKMTPIAYDSTRRIYRAVGGEAGGVWDAGKPLVQRALRLKPTSFLV